MSRIDATSYSPIHELDDLSDAHAFDVELKPFCKTNDVLRLRFFEVMFRDFHSITVQFLFMYSCKKNDECIVVFFFEIRIAFP